MPETTGELFYRSIKLFLFHSTTIMKSNAMQVMYNLCKEVTLFEFCATLSLIISLFYGKYNNNPLGLDHECWN